MSDPYTIRERAAVEQAFRIYFKIMEMKISREELADCLSRLTPGVDWGGSPKSSMAEFIAAQKNYGNKHSQGLHEMLEQIEEMLPDVQLVRMKRRRR